MPDADLTQQVRGEESFTPTEDLFLETLAARYRLGENAWTFDRKHARTAGRLSRRGLIWWKWGVAQGTILAGLTDRGREVALSATHTPPLAALSADLAEARAEREALAAQLDALRAGLTRMTGLVAEVRDDLRIATAGGTYADSVRDVVTDTIQRIDALLRGTREDDCDD